MNFSLTLVGACLISTFTSAITVPGTANPWLAGAADGTTGPNGYDAVPAQSPVVVQVQGGDVLTFSATGTAAFDPTAAVTGPEGYPSANTNEAAINGLAGITNSPINALIGVFLNDSTPAVGGEPADLDFAGAAKDYTTLAPALRQPFFIGDGMTSGNAAQSITAPAGATRLFLGIQDGYGWFNNIGSFSVTVTGNTSVPTITDTELPAPGSSFTVTGGTSPYTFIVTGGLMPPGLSLSSAGQVSGAPTSTSDGSVIVQVTDANSQSSTKVFDFHFDLGLPEITLRRVAITAGAGTQRLATFEVVAGDDKALSPLEADTDYTNASHCFEYRYKTGTGSFGNWTRAVYYPANAQPAVWFDNTTSLRFEVRAIDAKGNRSPVLAYDIAKSVAASTANTFGTTLAAPVTLISGAGSSIVKLFAEDLNNTSLTTEVAALDRETGKLSVVYNNNRTTPGSSAKTSLTIPGTPITDAAVGRLLPTTTTGTNDQVQDFVVCTANGLRIVTNKTGAAPVLALHPTTVPFAVPNVLFERVAVGDMDADGDDDIVAVGRHTSTGVYYAAVFPSFGTSSSAGFGVAVPQDSRLVSLDIDAVRSVAMGDINGDGAADVVIGGHPLSKPAGEDSVFCFISGPGTNSFSSSFVETTIGHPIVDVKIADYTDHILGQKDVIVGTIEGPDAAYSFATHMAKHRVLVHRGVGLFTVAPARKLAAINLTATEEANDKAVFNLALAPFSMLNGSLTNRITPDIVGCQYSSTSPGATLDDGFLAPADANGELHWMQGDSNGVVNIGTSTGKARRVALADLMGTAQLDLIVADADSGNVVVMRNDKALLNPLPTGVSAAKALATPTLTSLIPGGRTNGATSGISFQPWQFKYTIAAAPADTVAKVEYQLNGGAWTTLPGGFLAKSGTTFSTTVGQVPVGLLRFRCWATSTAQTALGVYDSYSIPSQAIRSIDSQDLVVTARAMPDSDPTGNVSTHDNEYIRYELNYENTGSAQASSVVLAGGIPANTTFGGVPSNPGSGATAGAVFDNLDSLKTKVVSWDLGTLAPGETGMRYFLVQVKSNALATLKGKSIELKAMTAASLKSPPTTAALFRSTTGASGTFGIYSSAPAPGFTPQAATGSTVSTPVVPPLTLTQVVTTSTVNPGSEVDVEIIVRNHGTLAMNNIVVEDFIENSFFVKSVRLRNPPNATTGNFTDAQDTQPHLAGSNPLLETRSTGRYLKWNVGTLAGTNFPPTLPPGECRMRYTLVVRYDVNPTDLINDVLAARQLDYGGLSGKGVVNGVASTARVDVMPRVTTAVQPQSGFTPPSISFTQELVPVTGSISNPSLFTEPSKRRTSFVSGEEMTSVTEGGLLRVKLRFENTGGTNALRSKINYELPGGTEFLGFVRLNEIAVSDPNAYSVFGAAGASIPTSDGARVKEVRKVTFNLGTLAPASSGTVDFLIGALDPPLVATGTGDNKTYTAVAKATNEKAIPAGSIIRSRAFTMESDSLSILAQGSPRQVPIFVARAIAFDTKVFARDNPLVLLSPGSPMDLTFRVELKNTGWVDADNVELIASIPAGTQYVSSVAVDPVTGTATAPTLNGTRQLLSGAAASTDAATQRVRFVFPSVASDYNGGSLNNPAARRAVDITVRVPWPRLASFPKNGKVEMTAQSVGVRTLVSPPPMARGVAPAPSQESSVGTAKFTSQLVVPGGLQKIAGTTFTPTTGVATGAYQTAQVNTGLYVRKWLPSIVRPGQAFNILIEIGNCRDTPINNVVAKIQVPYGTEFVQQGTSTGYTLSNSPVPNVYVWNVGTIQPGNVNPAPAFRTLRVRVKNKTEYEGNYLDERSLIVTGSFTDGSGVVNPITRVPDPWRMLVLSNNPVASGWQWFGAVLQGLGSSLFTQPNNNLRAAASSIGHETMGSTIAGADTLKLPNGVTIIQMGGGNIVAAGAGNIVAGGAGNIVAAGAGNIVAAGAGNVISITGTGLLTPTNIAGIVAGGAGNIVAGGAGNMIVRDSNGGYQLLANDGASFSPISVNVAGIVAAGGGNIVASGGGNIVAAGAGNAVGSVVDLRGGNVTVNSGLIANDGASLLANDGASLLANDGGSLIANDGGSIVAAGAGNLINKTNQ